jgi:L-lactate dehydrogenase complex protein LldG
MSTAREDILNRIRAVQNAVKAGSVSREYKRVGTLTRSECIQLFIDRLVDYDAIVHCCEASQIADSVHQALRASSKSSLLFSPALPEEWLPPDLRFIRDRSLTYAEIDASEGVLTGCAAAIALTGTIVLRHSEGEGRRALTLIPDYHLCVVFENQVVETVAEGIEKMASFSGYPITTVSGPSATADIEMTRVKGVHGPRTLEVILVKSKISPEP